MQVKPTLKEKFDDLKLCNFYFYRMFPHTFYPPPPPQMSVSHIVLELNLTGLVLRS